MLEKADQPGGVWKYDEATNTDASMYKVLLNIMLVVICRVTECEH